VSACHAGGAGSGTIDRLFVFEVGETRVADLSPWTGSTDAGRPWVFANHCYLIVHRRGVLLWDTGFADAIAALPDGLVLGAGNVRVRVERPLLGQLREAGFRASDVTHLALSHFHIDHAGNANAFASATLLVQQLEHDAAFGPHPERFGYQHDLYARLRGGQHVLLRGDHDVFGDGSVVIVATPGHTPGHQSLLVRLANAGPLLLSGDVAHLRRNWDQRRTPASNFDRAMTVRSMARLAALLREHGARLVIHHDRGDGARLPKAPAFLD
jgi:glyoxylase-like metal-dependent hydrolase (beta-lactamase superfamily II)